jgi:hypothetical protein
MYLVPVCFVRLLHTTFPAGLLKTGVLLIGVTALDLTRVK